LQRAGFRFFRVERRETSALNHGLAAQSATKRSRIDTSATDLRVVTYMRLQRFNGASRDDVK